MEELTLNDVILGQYNRSSLLEERRLQLESRLTLEEQVAIAKLSENLLKTVDRAILPTVAICSEPRSKIYDQMIMYAMLTQTDPTLIRNSFKECIMKGRIKSIQDMIDGTRDKITDDEIGVITTNILSNTYIDAIGVDIGKIDGPLTSGYAAVEHVYPKLPQFNKMNPNDVRQFVAEEDIGKISDGYHTFNELYDHRAKLFSVICNLYPTVATAWKSKKHHDGTMYEEMFIVGVNTPKGPATYHYNINPYWTLFNVKILDSAPEWDGHTPSDAIERILSLAE